MTLRLAGPQSLASIWYSWGKVLKIIAVLKIMCNLFAKVIFFFSHLQNIGKKTELFTNKQSLCHEKVNKTKFIFTFGSKILTLKK